MTTSILFLIISSVIILGLAAAFIIGGMALLLGYMVYDWLCPAVKQRKK